MPIRFVSLCWYAEGEKSNLLGRGADAYFTEVNDVHTDKHICAADISDLTDCVVLYCDSLCATCIVCGEDNANEVYARNLFSRNTADDILPDGNKAQFLCNLLRYDRDFCAGVP